MIESLFKNESGQTSTEEYILPMAVVAMILFRFKKEKTPLVSLWPYGHGLGCPQTFYGGIEHVF